MEAVEKPKDWPSISDIFPAMGKYADEEQRYTDTNHNQSGKEESITSWLDSINLPFTYSGLILVLKQTKLTEMWFSVPGLPNIIRSRYDDTAYNRPNPPDITANLLKVSLDLFFLKNGKLHNNIGPASYSTNRACYYLGEQPSIALINKSNEKVSYYSQRELGRWYTQGYESKGHYLNGIYLTNDSFKQFKKSGAIPSKEMMGARLQLFGKVIVGEELAVYGDEATGRIIWVRSGDTLYVLEAIARNTKRFDTIIYNQKRAMRIAENDTTRVVEKTASELEEMFLDTASFMAKSITPSLVR